MSKAFGFSLIGCASLALSTLGIFYLLRRSKGRTQETLTLEQTVEVLQDLRAALIKEYPTIAILALKARLRSQLENCQGEEEEE